MKQKTYEERVDEFDKWVKVEKGESVSTFAAKVHSSFKIPEKSALKFSKAYLPQHMKHHPEIEGFGKVVTWKRFGEVYVERTDKGRLITWSKIKHKEVKAVEIDNEGTQENAD